MYHLSVIRLLFEVEDVRSPEGDLLEEVSLTYLTYQYIQSSAVSVVLFLSNSDLDLISVRFTSSSRVTSRTFPSLRHTL